MIPDELFESLCSPGQDVCPLLPAPAQDPVSIPCAALCPVCALSKHLSTGLGYILSNSFEILPEELRYLRHPNQCLHTAVHENEVSI
jgi:hypothetical protein